LARAAEIVGERWTLLIIRELLLGARRFGDLGERLSGVSPTLLTERLNALIEGGVVRRALLPAPFSAHVYELTETGQALQPAIRELIRWGGRFLFPPRDGDAFEPDWALLALGAITRREPTPTCRIGLRLQHPERPASFIVEGGPSGAHIAKGELAKGAVLESRFDALLRILARDLSIDAAIGQGQAKVLGAKREVRKLPQLFEIPH
jgi:DNA-binding HxlR family transcriptional regulator